MTKRIALALSHSIEEHDQLRLLASLGYEVLSIGGYIDPRHPHDPKRPPVPEAGFHPELKEAVDSLGTDDNLGAAQSHIPELVLDWLGDDGVIIFHHYMQRLFGQWERLSDWRKGSPGRRIIWRSVGQSDHNLEAIARWFRHDGLERVAYSPRERHIPGYSGHDAVIRFYADPQEWTGWTGEDAHVVNVTQHLMQRGSSTNGEFWVRAVEGLPNLPIGDGSEVIGGTGVVPVEEMQRLLRRARAYLYTGTQPASYTLGFLEAAMTGVPIVSIGPDAWSTHYTYGADLFEGHELAWRWSDDPVIAGKHLMTLLSDHEAAREASAQQRAIALREFDMATVGAQWRAFLG